MPWPLWRFVFGKFYAEVQENPASLAQMNEEEPEVDHQTFEEYNLQPIFARVFGEAFRQGTLGPAWEGHLMTRPWGFDLEKIRTPVNLWQGEADVIVTPAMGRAMAERIPTCQAHFLPGEGHLLIFKYWEEILKNLTT
jgi:pimeloyl-ACP methyl ester carboxylesterase